MVKKASFDNERARLVVAQEAARLIVDQGIRDYGLAKKKAAQRLGMSTRGSLPGNSEVVTVSLKVTARGPGTVEALATKGDSLLRRFASYVPGSFSVDIDDRTGTLTRDTM